MYHKNLWSFNVFIARVQSTPCAGALVKMTLVVIKVLFVSLLLVVDIFCPRLILLLTKELRVFTI